MTTYATDGTTPPPDRLQVAAEEELAYLAQTVGALAELVRDQGAELPAVELARGLVQANEAGNLLAAVLEDLERAAGIEVPS